MKILFDHGAPRPLRRRLHGHSADTAAEMGWDRLANGDLIDRAESQGYEVLITTDQSMRHQQNLTGRRLAIIVLLSTKWSDVRLRTEEIRAAIDGIQPGEVREVPIARARR